MDIISITSLFGIIGLLTERIFKVIRKSRCTHIHSKCCGSEIEIERQIEEEKKI
jgi:hypothetical protein